MSATAIAVLAGLSGLATTSFSSFATKAWGQQGQKSASIPHKVGLIDMAEVFNKYEKFKLLREGLKAEVTASDQIRQQRAMQIKTLQGQLKSGTYSQDSPDYSKLEKKLIGLTAEYESFRKSEQRKFMRKETQIFKTIYLEVSDAVRLYTHYNDYTLIIRYSRKSLDEAEKPNEVLQHMNQLVVVSREEDDITKQVLDYLNRKYNSASANNKSQPPRTGNQPRRNGTRRN